MTRSILSASLVRPIWQHGTLRIEGPDEDAFTLGLSALTRLGSQVRVEGRRALQRLHLVGSFPAETDWAFAEALGASKLEVRRHPPTSLGVWGALAAAAHDEGSTGREAVVCADVAAIGPEALGTRKVRHGAGAAAFLFGDEPGLAVLRHGFHGNAPGRAPSMKSSIAGWLDDVELAPARGNGEVVFEVEDDAPRWHAAWEEAAPGLTVTILEFPSARAGPAPTLRAARLLWELGRRLRSGGSGIVAEATRARSGFAGFRLDGPVRWLGSWGALSPGFGLPTPRFLERISGLDAVSQGAYVPHPRYLENLASRWRLMGERCAHCRALTFPITGRCRSCDRSDGLHAEALPRTGLEVESVTTISPAAQPAEFDTVVDAAGGYDVAVVALGEGVRATVQLTDATPGRLRIGDRVSLALRRLYPMEGEWRYGLKAVPQPAEVSPAKPRRLPTATVSRARRPSSEAPTAHRATPHTRAGRAGARLRRAR